MTDPAPLSRTTHRSWKAVLTAALAALSLVAAVGAAPAQTPQRKGPLAIHGVEIGMDRDSAIRALERSGLYDEIEQRHQPCLSEDAGPVHVERDRRPYSGACLRYISGKAAGRGILIGMTEDLPRHPGRSIVTGINLNLTNTEQELVPSEADFIRALVEHYGEPDVDETRTGLPPRQTFRHPRLRWLQADGPPLEATLGGFRSLSLHDATLERVKEEERARLWRMRERPPLPTARPRL